MFFLWFSRSWSPYWSFSSFSGAGQTNNAEGSFFLTFRSNREIFFLLFIFFRLRGMGGGNERYSFNYFCFFERKHHLFSIVFQTYNWCSESYRIGLAFRAVFLRFGFFSLSSMIFFRSRIFFCLRFLFFLYFFRESARCRNCNLRFHEIFFREQRWWWGGVFGICSTKWRGWVTTK